MSTQDQGFEQSLRLGRELAEYFQRGGQPQPQPSPIVLQPGEQYFGQVPAQVLQWQEGDGVYTSTSVFWFGGILGTVAALGTTAVVNGAARRRAEREMAARWRPVDSAIVHVTNRRLALEGNIWTDVWYGAIRKSDCNATSILFEVAGWRSTCLALAYPHYWFVMMRKLAYDEVVMPPEPNIRPAITSR
jgi:hypothetical protein